MANKPMTHEIREKIKHYTKNRIDISDVIEGIDIKGEDLRDTIINRFNRVSDNISGAKFSRAIIGTPTSITNLSGTKMINCMFDDTQFIGTVFMRSCNCRDSVFSGALMHNLQYQNTDFRGCKFCETAIRLGTTYSVGSKFSKDVFQDLAKMWHLKIEVQDEKD